MTYFVNVISPSLILHLLADANSSTTNNVIMIRKESSSDLINKNTPEKCNLWVTGEPW